MAQLTSPLPASTVVVARPTDSNKFEIFMNRRPENMDAYAGAYVFPGGRVEAADWSSSMLERTTGLAQEEARRILDLEAAPELCLGFWVAAARELFEEAELCFFVDGDRRDTAIDPSKRRRIVTQRAALQRGDLDLPSLLEREQLMCDVSPITYFFHRVTPEHHPIRFDTRFYLTALPAGQEPVHESEEVAESVWITPESALRKADSKEFPMMPPTVIVLKMLADLRNWDHLVGAYNLKQS